MSEEEIKFRAYLLTLNSEFPTHRKTEAMEELLKIYHKQQKEIEELQQKLDNICKLREHFIEIYNDDEDEDNDI